MQIIALINALVFARSKFEGDLDNLLILAVVLDSYTSATDAARPAALTSAEMVFSESRATNALSIAQFTGIPRETVRRKVERMIERSWLARNEKGYLMLTEQGWVEVRASAQVMRDLVARATLG